MNWQVDVRETKDNINAFKNFMKQYGYDVEVGVLAPTHPDARFKMQDARSPSHPRPRPCPRPCPSRPPNRRWSLGRPPTRMRDARYEIRDTRYEMRDARCEIRDARSGGVLI